MTSKPPIINQYVDLFECTSFGNVRQNKRKKETARNLTNHVHLLGLRLYDGNSKLNDEVDAKALSYKKQVIDIYSNSWGPGDIGWQVEAPGPRLKQALKNGAQMVGVSRPGFKTLLAIFLRKPSASAYNTYLDLVYSGYHKNLIQ